MLHAKSGHVQLSCLRTFKICWPSATQLSFKNSGLKIWLGFGDHRKWVYVTFENCQFWSKLFQTWHEVDVDQKVNECSQRPPIGPNGSKLDMGGPEGSIYPYLRVRPWLMTSEVKKNSFTWIRFTSRSKKLIFSSIEPDSKVSSCITELIRER